MRIFENHKSGIVLPVVMGIVLVVSIISAGLFSYLSYHRRSTQRFFIYDRCRLAAQTALEIEKFETKVIYDRYYNDNPSLQDIQDWFMGGPSCPRTTVGVGNYQNALMQNGGLEGYEDMTATVIATKIERMRDKGLYMFGVTFLATATFTMPSGEEISKSIEERVHFGLNRSRVFDYAYFVNNYGWFQGGGCHANGDIRANGDMHLDGESIINGDAYAAINDELNTSGRIDVDGRYTRTRHQNLNDYRRRTGSRTRPTNPTYDSHSKDYSWEMGYDGNSKLLPRQDTLPMPFISELNGYKELARELKGTIKMGGRVVVDAVYEGKGPSGVSNGPDQGCLILDGTQTPIEINGPVVIDRDVIIRGRVKGQGAIYAGRNVHIIGDINYVNPPSWRKPDADPHATAENNRTKDLLTLAAKGNIVLGNPTSNSWIKSVERYITPPFVKPYRCHASDEDIGYPGTGKFSGDYTAYDGLSKARYRRWRGQYIYNGATRSRYYESLIGDYMMNALEPSTVENIDAVLYNNHAVMGRIGECNFNGALVCRDEGLIYSGNVYFNWDIRIASASIDGVGINAFLYMPLAPVDPYTASWKALP